MSLGDLLNKALSKEPKIDFLGFDFMSQIEKAKLRSDIFRRISKILRDADVLFGRIELISVEETPTTEIIYEEFNSDSELDTALLKKEINSAFEQLENPQTWLLSIQFSREKILRITPVFTKKMPEKSVEPKRAKVKKETDDIDKKKNSYLAVEPHFSFKRLILADEIKNKLMNAVRSFEVYDKVFFDWGFSEVEPFPKVALNLHGPPGVGKTLAAHAVADFLNKKIVIGSYANIESKYHGDGPKNIQAIFLSAQEQDAVLFIDEADSLLSRRLTNVTQGSEQAINSMRSELLICLEQYKGVVIFSTNLAENYDKAFETRIQHIAFSMPDFDCRKKLWEVHIPQKVPNRDLISFDELAEVDDICGRDIRNAAISAAISAALEDNYLDTKSLLYSINNIKSSRIKDAPKGRPLSEEEKARMTAKIKEKLKEKNKQEDSES